MLQFGADFGFPLNCERCMLIYFERCLSGITWRYRHTSLSGFLIKKLSNKVAEEI